MQTFFRSLVLCALLRLTALGACPSPHAEHVFIISIDGGKPAVIAQSPMPVLQRLVHGGAYTWSASTIYPSITLPAHTSMLTGVGPDKHHILWNSWRPSKGVVSVTTVFAEAKKAALTTAMFVGKEKFRHLAQPGTVDKFEFGPEGARKSQTVGARIVAEGAAHYILEHKPNLCFIHFADPDTIGHKYGWGSAQQIKALGDVDGALGDVIGAISAAGLSEESVVIITADHGGHGRTHGTKRPEDMLIPWIAWGKDVQHDLTLTQPITTCDTAATALWALGLPVPDTFEGKPVTSAFTAPAEQLAAPVATDKPRAGVGL
ncbi:MAG TPA: alkaline phosphatase family protein [Candidatus Acidoferrum sp.]|nr:alkaline phosphatase family protein [Candidatus Acidoferrum sp.]